jgi:alpha-galactosidase
MRATSKLAVTTLLSTLVACGSSSNTSDDGGSPDGPSGPDATSGVDSAARQDAQSGSDSPAGVDSTSWTDAASGTDSSGKDAPSGADATDAAAGNDASGDAGHRGDAAAPDAATLGIDPPMGWSSWSFVRFDPTESVIEAQAKALQNSGLSDHGYRYINIDDYYYLNPSTQVDTNGRWVVDSAKFPNGMAAVASYVHGLGLKFGMYLTPGIPVAAVTQNTPIEGTTYHAADIAVAGSYEINYNFGDTVMQYIDYSKPGAQAFIDSWANLLASYGVDYVKIDGVGSFDIPDVQAWSTALKSSGRVIHLELSNRLSINDATTWASLSNGWRIDGDIECYCPFGNSYPLTSWGNVSGRFGDDPPWQPFSGRGARNDLDSIEVGNGDNDGLAPAERQTQLSLWALAASPLLLGVDLTNLDSGDLALLTNDEVVAVDQAGVAAKQLVSGNAQVWVAAEPDGSFAVGLFNLGGGATSMTIPWSDVGISGSATVRDLWAQMDLGSFTGSFTTSVASHAVALLRIQP